ncbi:DegV family EDD domain-containing protein [Erysipelothrix rhusiopathiae]|uniref:DegV family protein n=1 Tax=Erysipelothrix piscisicarius TaxID=2485784 RepID=A0A3Q8S6Q3_9FIRM|nr:MULTISPECIES: DegV family protein [Erysipelothrix]AZK43646.1 DegV family protein [Erysipelothrix piscisicarius]MBK2404253.1 DegV family EDD domain-containing protein [Erysipelothrix sp. strain 2 (EsS2-7-Brazil)]NBA01284.1 DegV family EDD domain-containing protein [Erysipelothrix rhusiopathiae]
MKNLAIVCDSSVCFTPEEIKKYNVFIAPLTLIHNNVEYLDQETISKEEVHDLLSKKEKIMTSQPNLGSLINLFESIRDEGYHQILSITLSSNLSGTYSAFNQAASHVENCDIRVVDSFTLGGPVQQTVKLVRAMELNGITLDVMIERINKFLLHTESFVYPQNLDQLRVSGRISKHAATLASLLKVKPLLYLENHGLTIEKFGTARTETKIFELLINHMKEQGITPEAYDFYYLHSDAKEIITRLRDALLDSFGNHDAYIMDLPAAVATHAGLGTVAIQWIPKTDKYIM